MTNILILLQLIATVVDADSALGRFRRYINCDTEIFGPNVPPLSDAQEWFAGLMNFTAYGHPPNAIGCLRMAEHLPNELYGGSERPLDFSWPSAPMPRDLRLLKTRQSNGRGSSRVRPWTAVAVMGLHVASSLEVGSAIEKYFPGVKVRYLGHPCLHKGQNHACEFKRMMMPTAPDHDWVGEILMDMFGPETLHEREWSLKDVLEKAFSVFEDPGSDLWLCTGPLPLCYILSILHPPNSTLHVHTCAALLWGTVPSAKPLRLAILAFARQLVIDGRLVTDYDLTAVQYAWQTGVLGAVPIPVVHRAAWYLPEGVVWSPPDGRAKTVLVHRGRFWTRPSGQIFLNALEAILLDTDVGLVYGNDLTPEESTFESWTMYSAVVFALNDVTMYTFTETLHLGIPMLISGSAFATARQRSVPYGTIEQAYAETIARRAFNATSPFLEDITVAEAMLLSDITTIPERFTLERPPWIFWNAVDELAEIMTSLTYEDLKRMSEETIKLSMAVRKASAAFWSGT
ncbi:hypothetical protein FOZ63_002408 [Perkinsus olseni]|uniref:Uncharacterized protein n=1 Tax=Perkinsus olseni TaxID=32597 RepID=A0A7J6SKS3_PEROL|nr:hypothetical protein FOZ63_002408 [Perkinsus olseni]